MSLEPVHVEVPDKRRYAEEAVSAAFEMREQGYEPGSYQIDVDVVERDIDSFSDEIDEGATLTIHGTYEGLPSTSDGRGVSIPNPDIDTEELNEEDREEYRKRQETLQEMLESGKDPWNKEKVENVPVNLPNRVSNIDNLRRVRNALEETGFKIGGYRANGYGKSEKSPEESLEDLEQSGISLGIYLETPLRETGDPVFDTQIVYTDEDDRGYFHVDTQGMEPEEVDADLDFGLDEWTARVGKALMDEDLPIMIGDSDNSDNRIIE